MNMMILVLLVFQEDALFPKEMMSVFYSSKSSFSLITTFFYWSRANVIQPVRIVARNS